MSHLIYETSYETTQSCEMAYEALQFFFVVQSRCFEDDFHLSRINFNSSLGYHKPQKFLCIDAECALSQIKFHVVRLHKTECLFQVLDMLNSSFALYNNVINVDFHSLVDQGLEYFFHQSLVGNVSILESKWYDSITIQPLWCDKSCFLLIWLEFEYLVVSEKGIQKREHPMPNSGVNYLIYSRQRKAILWACVIQVCLINVDSSHSIFLLNYHHVC